MKIKVYIFGIIIIVGYLLTACSNDEINTKNEKTDKNNILNNKEYNKIVYWIGGQGIEITDKVDVENIVEILSTVPVERKEKAEERAGGIFLDLISDGNQEERIVILSDYISYNNEYYYTKYDVIPSVEEIIEDEAKKNGLEYLFEDTSTGHQGCQWHPPSVQCLPFARSWISFLAPFEANRSAALGALPLGGSGCVPLRFQGGGL